MVDNDLYNLFNRYDLPDLLKPVITLIRLLFFLSIISFKYFSLFISIMPPTFFASFCLSCTLIILYFFYSFKIPSTFFAGFYKKSKLKR